MWTDCLPIQDGVHWAQHRQQMMVASRTSVTLAFPWLRTQCTLSPYPPFPLQKASQGMGYQQHHLKLATGF
jgi:hypothetical protein